MSARPTCCNLGRGFHGWRSMFVFAGGTMRKRREWVVTLGAVVTLVTVGVSAQPAWREEVTIDGDPVMRGLPKDAIPAIDRPVFVPADRAVFVRPEEPVIGVALNGEARAYPTWLLNAHEIVNDRIGNRAIAVTW